MMANVDQFQDYLGCWACSEDHGKDYVDIMSKSTDTFMQAYAWVTYEQTSIKLEEKAIMRHFSFLMTFFCGTYNKNQIKFT